MKKIFLLLSLVIGANLNLVSQTLKLSANTGLSTHWTNNNSWVDNIAPPSDIPNNYSFGGIQIQMLDSISLSSILKIGNKFIINVYGKLTVQNIDTKNQLDINVFSQGLLTVLQDVEVDNKMIVNIYEGGTMNVNGKIEMKNGANLEVNGSLSADIISGGNNNNLDGSGSIYLPDPGSISGINLNGFDGNIVFGDTDLSLPIPYLLEGEASLIPTVLLEWQFANDPNPDGFIGFQLFKNNDLSQPTYLAELISIFSVSGVNLTTALVQNYLDTEVAFGNTPKYYVRAVYLIDEVVKFSAISNVVDYFSSPLPIELLSFKATPENNQVKLKWVTASEINNDYFTLERSTDIHDWEIIGIVSGAGTTSVKNNYEFLDYYPLPGISYYRLKQTDFDGSFEYFPMVAVEQTEISDLKIIKTQEQILVSIVEEQTGWLEVIDMNGRIMKKISVSGTQAIPISKGAYLFRFTNANGSKVRKVIF